MTFPHHHHGMTQRAAGVSRPGPEPDLLSIRGVSLVAAGLVAALALAMTAVWLLEPRLAGQRSIAIEPSTPTPWARDWVHPGAELEAVRARAQQRLAATEWVDREAGVARIEIETAMRLLAERGWPPPEGDQ
jgi:hypothetical protein